MVVMPPDPMGAMAVGNGDSPSTSISRAAEFSRVLPEDDADRHSQRLGLAQLSQSRRLHARQSSNWQDGAKHDREFVYPASGTSHPAPDAEYLRENPNRLGLGASGWR
jgi:hypothetical protein